MEKIVDLSGSDLVLFVLTFFRMTGLLMVAPVFGSQLLPPTVKVFLSLLLAVLFFPSIHRTGLTVADANLGTLLMAVAWEMGVGLLIGFAATFLFSAVQLGGQLIDQEFGLMMANILDPISNEQISVIGQFKLFLSILVYLAIDGHHFLMNAAAESFSAVPLTGFRMTDGVAMHLSDTLIRDFFRMGVQIAAPSMATLLLITIAMAFMARTVPEMNIFILGFSLRIVVGMLVLVVGVGLFVHGFHDMSLNSAFGVRKLIRLMGG